MKMNTYSIRYIADKDNDLWDSLVMSSPQGDVFHLSFHLNAWEKHEPRFSLLRIGCFDTNNKLVGGQAFLYKKKLGFLRLQGILQTWTHIETPILSSDIKTGSTEYLHVLGALARKSGKLFFHYRFFLHPTLTDVRPYIYMGWLARPDFSHGWDLSDRTELIGKLKGIRRFRQSIADSKGFTFTTVTDPSIIDTFLTLYIDTSHKIGFDLGPHFHGMFREIAKEMLRQNLIQFVVCRDNESNILGIATYTLNRFRNSAYNFHISYNYSIQNVKDFMPALDLHVIEGLPSGITHLDVGEAHKPSLYFNKDAHLTMSVRYYVVQTPFAYKLDVLFKLHGQLKRKLKSLIGK